jgi:phosphoserine phosphatase
MQQLARLGPEDIEKLLFATHAGMTEEEFEAQARAFLDTARHPRFNVLYPQTAYQPMLELLALLRQNDFRVFICSGGGVEFMRVFSEGTYGIPPERVVGSSLQYEFRETTSGPVLVRKAELVSFNDKQMKPVNIQLHVGRPPILAVGNSDGDLQMFQFTDAGRGPCLNLLVHHDDAGREYVYDQGAENALAAAQQRGWTVVSVKADFKVVFPTEGSR